MQDQSGPEYRPFGGCLLRLFWFLGGPLVALFLLAGAALKSSGFPSWTDALYVMVVAAVLAARRIDVTKFGGVNAFGEPSSLSELRRFTAAVALVALLLWLVVRVGGQFFD